MDVPDFIIRRWGEARFSFLEQTFVVDQNGSACSLFFALPHLLCVSGDRDSCGRSGCSRVDADIGGELSGCLKWFEVKQPADEVDDVTGFVAAKALVANVYLHGRMTVAVERAAEHAVWTDVQPVELGCLPGGDLQFYGFKQIHRGSF